jgi:hypothetical protein
MHLIAASKLRCVCRLQCQQLKLTDPGSRVSQLTQPDASAISSFLQPRIGSVALTHAPLALIRPARQEPLHICSFKHDMGCGKLSST